MRSSSILISLSISVRYLAPGQYTIHNFPCAEDGKNCNHKKVVDSEHYVDPSKNMEAVQRRLNVASGSLRK